MDQVTDQEKQHRVGYMCPENWMSEFYQDGLEVEDLYQYKLQPLPARFTRVVQEKRPVQTPPPPPPQEANSDSDEETPQKRKKKKKKRKKKRKKRKDDEVEEEGDEQEMEEEIKIDLCFNTKTENDVEYRILKKPNVSEAWVSAL